MEEAKHTKGNWTVKKYRKGMYGVGVKETDDQVALIRFYPDSDDEAAANAALVSTAPELIESLKELCQLVKESARIYDNPFEGDDNIFEAIKKAQLVIEKAESPYEQTNRH